MCYTSKGRFGSSCTCITRAIFVRLGIIALGQINGAWLLPTNNPSFSSFQQQSSVLDSIRATMIDAPQNTRGFICVFIRFPLIYVKAKISRAGGCSADHP